MTAVFHTRVVRRSRDDEGIISYQQKNKVEVVSYRWKLVNDFPFEPRRGDVLRFDCLAGDFQDFTVADGYRLWSQGRVHFWLEDVDVESYSGIDDWNEEQPDPVFLLLNRELRRLAAA